MRTRTVGSCEEISFSQQARRIATDLSSIQLRYVEWANKFLRQVDNLINRIPSWPADICIPPPLSTWRASSTRAQKDTGLGRGSLFRPNREALSSRSAGSSESIPHVRSDRRLRARALTSWMTPTSSAVYRFPAVGEDGDEATGGAVGSLGNNPIPGAAG